MLSGGELQRTSIARAVISAPPIILADEPTADLDPATEWEIISLLDQINKDGIPLFTIKYLYYALRHGYWNNPYEIKVTAIEQEDGRRIFTLLVSTQNDQREYMP